MRVADRGRPFARLEMRGVSRVYGRQHALRGIDLHLDAGEFLALLGPSGCGKSTALSCLAGLQPLSGGEIWRDDERIDRYKPEQRGFGMVFQSYALFPHLSVQHNVEFGLSMRRVGKSERRRRAAEALRRVHLDEHVDKYPAQLSGGQQQRVAIARALAIEPQIVLMDEPLSNLDAALRVEMRTEIKRLHQRLGLSTIYVTHDQEEALSLADRIGVLREGRLEQSGTPEAVFARPETAYVAGFMGYRNLLPAVATSGAGPGGLLTVHCGDLELRGVVSSARPVGEGAAVTVAVRPDDFVVGNAGDNVLTVIAEVVEYMGRELQVLGRTASGTALHVRTDKPVAAGETLPLAVPAVRVLVFHGEEPAP